MLEPSRPPDSRRVPAPGPADALVLVLAAGTFLALAQHFRFLIDDAFISFRYAAHWAGGLGLRYNPGPGPAVEGYSNFLWVAMLAAARRLGVAPESASVALGLASGAALVALVFRELRLRCAAGTWAAAAGAAVVATGAGPIVWATGGLETASFALALFATATGLLHAAERGSTRAALAAGVGGATLVLLRVEGVLWAAAIAAVVLLVARPAARGRRRSLVAYAVPVVLVFAGYLTFRRLTYGEWVANTVRAKAGLSAATLSRGLRQTATFLVLFPLALPVLLAAPIVTPAAEGRRARLGLAMGVALCAYHVLVGGDWMPMFRFLVPLWPFLGLALGLLLARLPRVPAAGLGALVLATGLLPAFGVDLAPRSLLEKLYFRQFERGYETEAGRWETGVRNAERFELIGRALGAVAGPEDSIATGAIGAIGYYSGVRVYDCNGLIDPTVARRPASGSGTAGHDKRVGPSFFADRRPSWYGANVYPRNAPNPEAVLHPWVSHLMRRDPALARTCVLELRSLPPRADLPDGLGLALLAHCDDPERAERFWVEFSRRAGGRP